MERTAENAAQQDFLLYRREGRPEALGRVFDHAAPRLLLLAGHLTRDAAQAEDLVQATFLQAMRCAEDYDEARPLLPWLAGILRHRALDQHRRARLRSAAPLDEDSAAVGPSTLLEDHELLQRISAAVDELPAPYREVLVLRLVHGLGPTQIAHALGRAPGTVRMQQQRALERLRRALPASTMLGLGGLWTDLGRGLSTVRREVLARAESAHLSATATVGVAATTTLGGLTIMKLVSLACLALLAVVGLYSWRTAAVAPPAPRTPIARADGSPSGIARTEVAAATEPEEAGARERTVVPERSEPGSSTAGSAFTVRVWYESDGAPAEDVGVTVQPLASPGVAGRPGLEVRTDERGLARFSGLAPAVHEVLVDRLARPLEVDLASRDELLVAVPAGLALRGTVVDLEGRPVAGARVLRIQPRHADLLQATVHTDAAGSFELRDVEPGTELVARAAGHQPSEVERVRSRDGGTARVELRLGARGHVLRGEVRNADGTPAAHARVAIGVDEDARKAAEGSTRVPGESGRKNLDREALLLRTDEHGTFVCDEVPGGDTVVLARPSDPEEAAVGWESLVVTTGDYEVTVHLSAGAEVRGVVRDGSGRAVAGLTLEAEWEGTPALGQMEDDLGPWLSDRWAVSGPDGAFRLAGLLPGDYDLRVHGKQEVLLREELDVPAGASLSWEPVIEATGMLDVRLLGPDGAPLEGWSVTASEDAGRMLGARFLAARTDARGALTLHDLRAGRPHQLALFAPEVKEVHRVPVAWRDGVVPGGEPLDIQLRSDELPTASLSGVWTDSRGVPLAGGQLALERAGWLEEEGVRTDQDGRFRVEQLAAGTYLLRAEDPRQPRGTLLTELRISPAEQRDVGTVASPLGSRLVVELSAADGGPLEAPFVRLEPLDGSSWETWLVEDDGVWACAAVAPGRYRVSVHGRNAHAEPREVRVDVPGSETRVHIVCSRP